MRRHGGVNWRRVRPQQCGSFCGSGGTCAHVSVSIKAENMRSKSIILAALACAGFVNPGLGQAQRQEQTKPESLLSADEVAVYRTFLDKFPLGDWKAIKVANGTFELIIHETDRAECMRDAVLDLRPEATKGRIVDSYVVRGTAYELVDGARHLQAIGEIDAPPETTGGKPINEIVRDLVAVGPLLKLSTIGFDRSRLFAVMKYDFICGRRCGGRATVIFAFWR